MPLREDDRARHSKDDLKYCVVCKQYLSPAAWAEHEHNPKARPGVGAGLRPARPPGLLTCTLLLGPCAIGNTSGVIVLEGVEVFRLRHRGEDGHIAVNLDVRGPDGKQLAKIERNSPQHLAPGLAFATEGPSLRLAGAAGAIIASATAEGSDGIRLAGDFHANGLHLHIASDALTIGGQPFMTARLYGPGAAVLIRKGKGISFAKS